MEQNKQEIKELLEKIIGKTPLSVIQTQTGLPKATASRLLNGQFKGRASATALWKLTSGNPENKTDVSFSDIMIAAGYSDAEVRKYELKFMASDDKMSSWERNTLVCIQSRLSEQGIMFETNGFSYNGLHASALKTDIQNITEWILLFYDADDIDLDSCFSLFGKIALYPFKRGCKLSVVMRTDKLKKYAYKTSLAGIVSVIVTDSDGSIKEEIYLNDDDKTVGLIL